MNANKKTRVLKRNVTRLNKHGYRTVSQLTLLLARSWLIDPFVSGKSILPRRPLSVLSFLTGAPSTATVQLSVATTHLNMERAAAEVSVQFFGLFGKACKDVPNELRLPLFADPIDNVSPQNVYFDVPKGARWVLVTIQRNSATRKIGAHGSLRPKVVDEVQNVDIEEALAGRDRLILERHLKHCQQKEDRRTAMRVLERLIYLDRQSNDENSLRHLTDVERVFGGLPDVKATDGTIATYKYEQPLTGDYAASVPLSKWVEMEVQYLLNEAKDAHVTLAGDQSLGPRLLACRIAGLSYEFDGDGRVLSAFHPWVFDSDFKEIHTSNP